MSYPQQYTHGQIGEPAPAPVQAPPSFLFIVNDLITNDSPERDGSVPQRLIHGRWHPPQVIQGFFEQQPGFVYRWKDGVITFADGYTWTNTQTIGSPPYANGRIWATASTGATVWPEYYRAATVFYCNRFDKFFTTRGDAGTKNMANLGPEDWWQPLTFFHGSNNISYVDHAGDEEHAAVRKASWIEELLPNAYRREDRHGLESGGLSGLLPIVIALVAFSCRKGDFDRVLRTDRAWRGHRWVPHGRESGRESSVSWLGPSRQHSF